MAESLDTHLIQGHVDGLAGNLQRPLQGRGQITDEKDGHGDAEGTAEECGGDRRVARGIEGVNKRDEGDEEDGNHEQDP